MKLSLGRRICERDAHDGPGVVTVDRPQLYTSVNRHIAHTLWVGMRDDVNPGTTFWISLQRELGDIDATFTR